MKGKRFIKSLKLKNFLSFGPKGVEVELEPLNVLIGPNGAGKSNFVEAISVLRAAPTDLTKPFVEAGGGVHEWLWKGAPKTPTARIESVVDYPDGIMPLRYRIAFTEEQHRVRIVDELVENQRAFDDAKDRKACRFYLHHDGTGVFFSRLSDKSLPGSDEGRKRRILRASMVDLERSVLSRRIGAASDPEIIYLAEQFRQVRIYRDWHLGPGAEIRSARDAGLPKDFLSDGSEWPSLANLALVLNSFQKDPATWETVLRRLQEFCGRVVEVNFDVYARQIQLMLREKGAKTPIPTERLSDGTLQYLCLLSILCHPSPPPLVCIEEPEVGLHPDGLAAVAELLLGASERTQLIVTTHSDALVSALSEVPEAVIVCEWTEQGTSLRRLEGGSLQEWLKDYALGDLWRMGEIGGNP